MSNELTRYDVMEDACTPLRDNVEAGMYEMPEGYYVLHSDALAAIEAAKPKWLDISEAPKDGTYIDVSCDGHRFVDVRWTRPSRELKFSWCYEDIDGEVFYLFNEPTHFMLAIPLPQKASKPCGSL